MKHLFLALFTVTLATISKAQTATTIPDKPEMITVEGGTFTMGSTFRSDETPHTVTLSSYKIGKYPVTVGQYKKYCTATGTSMPSAPEWGWNDNHPMVLVSYNDAVSYCNWLGETYGGDWRLPTEAQWEFAARGGNKSDGYTYSGSNDFYDVGWNQYNAGDKTNTVGQKKANELGIYDMSGNVWEWCEDYYGEYSAAAQKNPKGAIGGSRRVLRGGSWFLRSACGRVSFRGLDDPALYNNTFGFRVMVFQ